MNCEYTMHKYAFLLFSALSLSANATYAQGVTAENACEDDTCLELPAAGDVQNFLPSIIPFIGGGGLLAAGLANGNPTSSTTSTTSTD